MSTSPPQREPLTEAEQKRIARLQTWSLPPATRNNMRYGRPLLVLFICGFGFFAGGLSTWNGDLSATTPGWLTQNFGPHGNAVFAMLLGSGMLIGGVLLARKLYRARKAFDA